MAQVIVSTTEVLLQAGSGVLTAASSVASSSAAATLPAATSGGAFATVRVGETTSSLQCAQLQRGWREAPALIIRTGTDIASAGLSTHLDNLKAGTAAALAFAARLQHLAATTAAQSSPSAAEGITQEQVPPDGKVIHRRDPPASGDNASATSGRLPAPSAATAAAYPVTCPPDASAAPEPAQVAHRPGFRRANGPEDGGRLLLQARLHVATTTAELTQRPASALPLLRATIAAAGVSGASSGVPAGPRSISASATPQPSGSIAEHEDAIRQPAQTPTSASVWLQRTDGGARGGNVIANTPWQFSVASTIVEVAAPDREGAEKAAGDSGHSDASGGTAATSLPAAAIHAHSALRQLLMVGQLTVDLLATAQQRRSGDASAQLQLQGNLGVFGLCLLHRLDIALSFASYAARFVLLM